jgi:NTE family protein
MKALVMAGGAEKCSFQVGAVKYLLGDLRLQYDAYIGSSAGTINAAFLAQFKTGNEQHAAENLEGLWNRITAEQIYRNWFLFGRLAGIWKSSIFNSKPMQKLIEKTISLKKIRNSGKITIAGAVSVDSGKYTCFHPSHPHFLKAIAASATFPGAFTPVKIDNHYFIDAGIKQCSPLEQAIQMGAEDITLIFTSPEMRVKRFTPNPTSIDVLFRALDLTTDKIMTNDLEKVLMYNRLACAGLTDKKEIKIQIIRPDINLTEDILKFDPGHIRDMINIGYHAAKRRYIIE